MGESGSNKQIGYLLRSYPRLSQTFVLNEILALEKIGVSIQIFALTNPHEKVVQRQVDQVRAPVIVIVLRIHPHARNQVAVLRHGGAPFKRRLLKALFGLTFGFTLTADVDRTQRRPPPHPTRSPEGDAQPREERSNGSE